MPYEIRKLPTGQFAKISKATGKVVSRHPTRQKAVGSILAEINHTGEDIKKVAPGIDLNSP